MVDQETGEIIETAPTKRFDPSQHLTLVTGRDYLEVKWRLAWFRSEHPDGLIETDMVSHQNGEAVFKARVSIPGGGVSTGWGSEDTQGFGDYIEKAETKAVGRALGMLGFGTQFTYEFDSGKIADSPVQRQEQRPVEGTLGGGYQRPSNGSSTIKLPSDRQWKMFNDLIGKHHLSAPAVAQSAAGYPMDKLSSGGMSKCIDQLLAIDRGDLEVPSGWYLSDEDAAAPPRPENQPKPSRATGDESEMSPAEKVRVWTKNIEKAGSSRTLDAIYKSLEAAGLSDNEELLGLMAQREAAIQLASDEAT